MQEFDPHKSGVRSFETHDPARERRYEAAEVSSLQTFADQALEALKKHDGGSLRRVFVRDCKDKRPRGEAGGPNLFCMASR